MLRRLYNQLPDRVRRGLRQAYLRLPATVKTVVRHQVVWPTSDAARLARAHTESHGRLVRAGPFRTMTYPEDVSVDSLLPKLIGSYERELHPALERMIAASPRVVVNIGAGDGYYAVGLAKRLPDATVFGFDPDRWARRNGAKLAAANYVDVIWGRRISAADLGALKPDLVVCDCEGCEEATLDPYRLRSASILVELHDFIRPSSLPDRFAFTHDIEIIEQQSRDPADYPDLQAIPNASIGLDEARPQRMRWAAMVPLSRQGTRTAQSATTLSALSQLS